MNDKKQEEKVVPVVDNASSEKDLISSEDVLAVVSGDQVALVEQMERAKEAALSQKGNAQEIAAEKAKKKLEEEEKKKKAIMEEVKRRKEEAQKREKLAREEAERKKALAEEERQKQLAEKKRIEEENKAKEEKAKLEAERKKQEKEAAIKAREDAKKAKVQARIDAKNAKIEARENAKRAKEAAKKAKLEAQKAKAQARIDAKKARQQAKKEAKNKKGSSVRNKTIAPTVSQAPAVPVTSSVSNTSVPQKNVQPVPVSSTIPVTPNSTPITTQANKVADKNNSKPVSTNVKASPNNKQKKEGNFKYYMTFIFLGLLILMVAFLPNISSLVSDYFASKNQVTIPEITTGILTCTMNTSDDKYDYYYEAKFNFKDTKMYRLTFSITTKGDQHLDAIELSAMETSCNLLRGQTETLDGVDVSCSLSNGVYENIQKLNYEDINEEKLTTAYLEAGGTYPNYKYGQDISDIEKEMKASNYTCERHS